MKQMNPFNLKLTWHPLFKWFEHGYHPSQKAPIYEYWQVGWLELQSFFRQPEPVEYLSFELIRSNGINKCAGCGIDITPENDSCWEVFTETGSQPECITCHNDPGNCKRCNNKLGKPDNWWLLPIDPTGDEWWGPVCSHCGQTKDEWMRGDRGQWPIKGSTISGNHL